jgi:DNA-binding transcriptional ArsR family regulator
MEIVFSDDDLARVRVALTLDPMSEVMAAAHHRSPQRPVLHDWARETAVQLGPLGSEVLGDLRSAAVQINALGMQDLQLRRSFDDRLEVGLSRPSQHWVYAMAELQSWGMPVQPGLLEARPRAIAAIGAAARRFHQVAVAPYWDQLNAAVAATATGWMRTLSMQGLEQLLNNLHPTLSWRPPALSVTPDMRSCGPSCPHRFMVALLYGPWGGRLPVSSRGLRIIPTAFSPFCALWMNYEPDRGMAIEGLIVPVTTSRHAFKTGSDAGDSLADLLGNTRACVLRACIDTPLTTTTLARSVGISNSSASEHATVLRSAGLITSERRGNQVIHHTTQLGAALAYNSPPEDA